MSTAEYAACRPDASELQRARWRLYAKSVIIGAMSIGSYIGLLLFAHGPLVAMLLAGGLVWQSLQRGSVRPSGQRRAAPLRAHFGINAERLMSGVGWLGNM